MYVCALCCRVVDVGSEWRTFSNEKSTVDRSRVGATEVSHFDQHFLLHEIILPVAITLESTPGKQ